MEFRADINGLRAVAVLAVLFYHFGLPGFDGGFTGVDIFYVISGYLMTGILVGRLDGGLSALGGFYLARARRIVPALLVLCAAVLLLGWFWVSPVNYAQLAKHAAASVAFVSNVVYWQQVNYFNPDAAGFWLLHTWSLSVEWQFYLVYPLVLLALRAFGLRDERRLRTVLIVAMAGSLALAVVATRLAPQAAFYLLPPRAWELLGGGVICLSQRSFTGSASLRRALVWIGLALLAGSIVVLDSSSPWATLWVALPVAGTMAVLLGNFQTPVLGNVVFQALGRWSYSIYLWHWPISVFLREWRPEATALHVGGAMGFSVLLGWLSFRLVENPSRRWLVASRPWPQAVWQVVASAAVAGLALSIVSSGGVPTRLPSANAELYQRYVAERQHWSFPHDCAVENGKAPPERCALGPVDAPRVLIIGDSHAEQWHGWFADFAATHRVRLEFFTLEGCSIGYEGRAFCDGFWPAAVARAQAEAPRLSAIILVSNWQIPPTLEADWAPWQRTRDRLPPILTALRATGVPMMFTAAFPTVGRSTPDDIAARVFRNSPVDDLATWDCKDFSRRAAPINAFLVKMARETSTPLVDPAATMCTPDGRLSAISNDQHLMFRDGNHVSTVAAKRWGGGLFEHFLNEIESR